MTVSNETRKRDASQLTPSPIHTRKRNGSVEHVSEEDNEDEESDVEYDSDEDGGKTATHPRKVERKPLPKEVRAVLQSCELHQSHRRFLQLREGMVVKHGKFWGVILKITPNDESDLTSYLIQTIKDDDLTLFYQKYDSPCVCVRHIHSHEYRYSGVL